MVDLAAVTATVTGVMAVLGPYLASLQAPGKVVLEAVEKKLGERVFEVLQGRLTGKAKAALEDAVAEPDKETLDVLKTRLQGAVEKDGGLAQDLADLVKEVGPKLTMTQTGDGNKGAQIVGSGNSVNFSG